VEHFIAATTSGKSGPVYCEVRTRLHYTQRGALPAPDRFVRIIGRDRPWTDSDARQLFDLDVGDLRTQPDWRGMPDLLTGQLLH
jgi:hypothetical protein